MKEIVHAQHMAARFRKLAVTDRANAVRWLEEAKKWQRLSEEEIASHFQECNMARSIGAPAGTRERVRAYA